MQESDFKLSLQLRIDWSEMDTYQHVNNVNFMKYMQSARVQFWEVSGLATLYAETKKGPMLVSTQCDFKNPLFFPGNVIIKTKVEFIKNSSFGLHHKLYNDEGVLCAEGHDVAVCFDFNTDKTFMITDELRQLMKQY
ncbi:acyl-CoA thioester hydrolase [Aquimarina sp. MAR_2010_214]|uniref:acyl-CoA thioesterase n=1 Tax=Aquimarina sp. MAR_2010_214 TaxID=1250026 RepID=UPI000C70CB32|nr:acyl-CoA thioesterase [Aquimarina sp. MAR_2010_214]PKV48405.1 acyl-CoA thioester hydrolase [Aquimarina sp. MAR_2010_214]